MIKINPNIFRKYDIRGIADSDLNDSVVDLLGRAIGSYYRDHGQTAAVVGRDMRLSSPRIMETLTNALQMTGIDVIDIGLVPTPIQYFSLFLYNTSCGIMITGSHNPTQFNGMKISCNKSSIYGEEIQKIRSIIEDEKFYDGAGERIERDPLPDYIESVLERVQIKNVPFLIVDSGNGAVGPVIDKILKKLGIQYYLMNKEPDGTFPAHLPDPTVIDHIEDLINEVKKRKGIGIGFDGDGDRIGVIGEDGNIIWGDHLLGIYSKPIIKKKPGCKIIFDVKCSRGLTEYINSLGGLPLMYKTGHSLIKAKMKEEDAPIAGEMSGHMFFADNYYGFDDAIFAALRLLEIVSKSGKALKDLDKEIPFYFATPEIRVDCGDEEKFKIVEESKNYFGKKYDTITIDGVRIEFTDGWGLIRPSNTQPILVLRFEARTEERVDEIKREVFDFLKRFSSVKF